MSRAADLLVAYREVLSGRARVTSLASQSPCLSDEEQLNSVSDDSIENVMCTRGQSIPVLNTENPRTELFAHSSPTPTDSKKEIEFPDNSETTAGTCLSCAAVRLLALAAYARRWLYWHTEKVRPLCLVDKARAKSTSDDDVHTNDTKSGKLPGRVEKDPQSTKLGDTIVWVARVRHYLIAHPELLVMAVARAVHVASVVLFPAARSRSAAWARANPGPLCGTAAVALAAYACYLFGHTRLVRPLRESTATPRLRDVAHRRLYLFDEQSMLDEADRWVDHVQRKYGHLLVDARHPTARRVAALTDRVLSANGLRPGDWRAVVVISKDQNAFAMANGHVIVTTGMARVTSDDQMCVVLGHELSHCLMRDQNHHSSVQLAAELLNAVLLAGICAACRLPVAAVAYVLLPFVWDLLVLLPLSRAMETHADHTGLLMAARACADVTSGRTYWQQQPSKGPAITSTHPTSASRADYLHRLEPEALRVQEAAECP